MSIPNDKAMIVWELQALAKKVARDCHDLRMSNINVEDWRRRLSNAIRESVEITDKPTKLTWPQKGTPGHKELCKWAKDVETQDWVMMHPTVRVDRKSTWRWVAHDKEKPGQIRGLERMRGIPRITNGIDVYMEMGDGTVFKAHLDNFVKDPYQHKDRKLTAKQEEFKRRMAEYI